MKICYKIGIFKCCKKITKKEKNEKTFFILKKLNKKVVIKFHLLSIPHFDPKQSKKYKETITKMLIRIGFLSFPINLSFFFFFFK